MSGKRPRAPAAAKSATQPHRKQWLKPSSGSKVIFRREALEDADRAAGEALSAAKGILKAPDTAELFSEGGFGSLIQNKRILNALERLDIHTPTAIQTRAIPQITSGRNTVVKAQTGSGKTLAFMLPVLERLLDEYSADAFDRKTAATRVVIISPTKELSQQTEGLCQALLRGTRLVVGSVAGGTRRDREKASLRKGVTVLCATPGRLVDHIKNTASLDLSHVEVAILDECDSLIAMGFEHDVSTALKTVCARRQKPPQVVLASATADERVLAFARTHVHEAKVITDGRDPGSPSSVSTQIAPTSIPASLRQCFVLLPTKMRLAALIACLAYETAKDPAIRIVVFVEARDVCTFLCEVLAKLSTPSAPAGGALADDALILAQVHHLHGGLSAEDRRRIWAEFMTGGGVLVTTDLSARGLNLGDAKTVIRAPDAFEDSDNCTSSSGKTQIGVDLVIHYEAPSSVEQYVHRAGRSGRLGQNGRSYLFLLESEKEFIRVLAEQGCVLEVLPADMLAIQVLGYNKPIRLMERIQMRVEELVGADTDFKRLASLAFRMYCRGYSIKAGNIKHIFRLRDLHLGHVAKSFGLAEPPSAFLEEFREKRVRHAKEDNSSRKNRLGTKPRLQDRDSRAVVTLEAKTFKRRHRN